ncbi:MAG TPA: hypothetical protein VGY57_04595, partial [Vicinamibacterales bacterium]|nr:hypothetical protein [Vicinamibacterales bacterium]
MTRLLRWVAVAIAIVAVIDPSLTAAGRVRPTIGLIAARGSIADRVRAALRADYAIVDGADPSAAALIVVGDRYPDEAISDSARVSTVSAPAASGVRIASLSAPRAIPATTSIHLEAELVSSGLRGRTTAVTASIGGAELARATHDWKDERRWTASLDVVPIGEPPFAVTVAADGPSPARATALVDRSDRLPVLVYDARPSWMTTFVRRALESDPRFAVSAVAIASHGIEVRSGQPQSLQSSDLDQFRAVLVGGLDKISMADAAALNRFMIERGGSVALLLDSNAVGRVLLDPPG